MTSASFSKGRAFIVREGRILDQRLAETVFDGAPATAVTDALRAYQNGDGGFGHGLEPDKRCPESQPLDVEVALRSLAQAKAQDPVLVTSACNYLDAVAAPDGGVPLVFPSIAAHPHAEHWGDGVFPPGLNPTAGLAGLLYELGTTHPWLDRATEFTWNRLEVGDFADSHTLLEVSVFLDRVPDQQRAAGYREAVVERLGKADFFHLDADRPGYGLTPLEFAPRPGTPWQALFGEARVDAHLDWLARQQEDDGGWPIAWRPPSTASTLEWRGAKTLSALMILQAYDRL